MKSVAYNKNTGETVYVHSTGVTFMAMKEAILDVLMYQGFDLFSHLDKAIETLVKLNEGNADFSIRVRISKDPVSKDEITHSVSVLKKERIKITEDGWFTAYGVPYKD
jgi:hypothetical protein